MLTRREIKKLITNLNNLEQGEPEDILSELIENIKIQIVNEEYIDFLGRLYRLKEALFKYIFVSTKESKNYKVSMHGYMVSKKNILCIQELLQALTRRAAFQPVLKHIILGITAAQQKQNQTM